MMTNAIDISSSSERILNPCGKYLAGVMAFTKTCSVAPDQISGTRNKSLLFGSSAPPGRPVRGRSRHRSACARAACTTRETIRAHVARPGPTLLSSPSTRLAVLPCGGHPVPSLHTAADGADAHDGERVDDNDRRLRGALVHRANRRSTAARPDAKRPVSSKVHVENHTLQSRGGHNGERTVS